MTPPLVSILIPAHNAERWIGDTLRSALQQTWPEKEVVVVDDGSTDNTAAIVRACRSPIVNLVSRATRGPSAAQNEALRHASGAFIQYLDADDLIAPDKIERQLVRLSGAVDWVACGEWARFRRDRGEAVFRPIADPDDRDSVEWLLRECAGGGPMLQPGRWLIPRAVAEKAGPWDERLTLNNDFEYIVRVLLASKGVRSSPGARLYYRSGNPLSLASARSPAAWQSAWLSLDLGTRRILQHTDSPEARAACADLFQQLAYEIYLEDPTIADAAERRTAELGGSSLVMGGGVLFAMLRNVLGWKRAKQAKRFAYAAGYSRLARLKEMALGRQRWRAA